MKKKQRNFIFKEAKLGRKLALAFSLVLIIPILILGTISYLVSKDTVEEQTLDQASGNIALVNEEIENTFQKRINEVQYFASIFTEPHLQDTDNVNETLTQYIALNEDVRTIYVGTEDNRLFYEPTEADEFVPKERDWYQNAMENSGQSIITEPYTNPGTGELIVTIARVTNDEIGVVAMDISIDYLASMVSNISIGEEGYVFLVHDDQYIWHPTSDTGDNVTESWNETIAASESGQLDYQQNGDPRAMVYETNPSTGWKIIGTMYTTEFAAASQGILMTTVAVIIGFSLIGLIVVFYVTRSITKPVKLLNGKVRTMSKGDLNVDIQVHSRDEIGQLAVGIQEMQRNLKGLIGQVQNASENLSSQSEELTQSSNEVKKGSEQIAATMQQLSSGGETQASSANELSTTMESFVGLMNEANQNGQQAQTASKDVLEMTQEGSGLMKTSVKQMEQIDHIVKEAVEKVQGLDEQSKQISELVAVIKDIADQTNLLALNAAIEAARAGENGKGFAVVADEVRKLAEQVGESVSTISEIVGNVQTESSNVAESLQEGYTEVEKGRGHIENTGQTFTKIEASIQEMANQIQTVTNNITTMHDNTAEMNSFTQEIAAISEESAESIEQTSASAQQSSSSMEEISSSSEDLAKLSEKLTEQVNRFKV